MLEASALWGTACNPSELRLPHPGASEVSEGSPQSLLEFCPRGTPASRPLCEKASGMAFHLRTWSHLPAILPPRGRRCAWCSRGNRPRERGARAEGRDQLPEARPRAQGSQGEARGDGGGSGARRCSRGECDTYTGNRHGSPAPPAKKPPGVSGAPEALCGAPARGHRCNQLRLLSGPETPVLASPLPRPPNTANSWGTTTTLEG